MRDGAEAVTCAGDEHQRNGHELRSDMAEGRRAGPLQSSAIAFEGSNGSSSVSETIPYEDVTDVRIARSTDDRISDRQTLVLELRSGAPIRIAGIVHPGIVSELAERLGRST
jgi:hypothetical protein